MKTLKLVAAVAICLIGPDLAAAVCPIPLEPTRTSFVTKVWIDGRGPFRFLVDTGTSVTVVSSAVDAGLSGGQTLQALSTTGPVTVRETTAESLRAGTVEVARLRVLISDLPTFASHGRIDGILGMNFLEGSSFLLDVKRRCLTPHAEDVRGGSVVGAERIAGRIAVVTDGLRFVLDSAASFPVLTSERAQALAMARGTFDLTSAAGKVTARSAHVRALQVGRLTLRDLDVALLPDPSTTEDGLLPVTIFSTVYVSADRTSVTLNGESAGRASRPSPRLDATLRRR
jgi:predicted aspartyl protease